MFVNVIDILVLRFNHTSFRVLRRIELDQSVFRENIEKMLMEKMEILLLKNMQIR